MGGKIYLVNGDGDLLAMEEAPYEAESLLQKLLAEYPDLLAGDQMRPTSPRRWLLVSRELGVPEDESEKGRWSLDHLFIDQDGIPTLVEVKRSSNTQIRREVVGQMLDYAANGTVYWSLEQITAAFDRRCERDGLDPDEVVGAFLGEDTEWSAGEFWQAVKTNLQAGRVRLVFVADRIPAELRRIIEFLNDQMDPAEVVGVEVPQFVGESQQALVPRVVGMTAEAERRKAVGSTGRRTWTVDLFMEELARHRSDRDVETVRRILDWANDRDVYVKWGTGEKLGSFSPKARVRGTLAHMFSMYTDFNVQLALGPMKVAPFDDLGARRQLADRLLAVGAEVDIGGDKLVGYPSFSGDLLTVGSGLDAFLSAWDWYLDELHRSATNS